MTHYKLYYFDIKGLAEPIRLALTQIGVPFEDIRVRSEDWPEMKSKMPFGQMPVLETDDGFVLSQSTAILRYIAGLHGLQPEDPNERAVADELATSWYDMFTHTSGAFAEQDLAKRKEKFLKLLDEFIHPRLRIFDKRLSHSKSGFLVGSKVTWADFVVYNFISSFHEWMRLDLDPYPNVMKFKNHIEALPGIKQWNEQHPDARWAMAQSPFD